MARAIFGINHPRDFWTFWNSPRFTGAISKFWKMHSDNLSQINPLITSTNSKNLIYSSRLMKMNHKLMKRKNVFADYLENSAISTILDKSICRLFHFLIQFFFTTSETELDYYHQKMNAWDGSRVAERLRIWWRVPSRPMQ